MWLPLTPLGFYRRSARLFPRKTAVVDGARRLTFAEFASRVERLAGALQGLGLRPREVVSILAPNTHHVLEAFHGVPLAGGVVHPVSPRRSALEIADLVNDGGARIVFFHSSLSSLLREISGSLKAVEHFVVLEDAPRSIDFPVLEYEALLEGAEPHAPDVTAFGEDDAIALFDTSGGEERPQGVLLSHRALALHALYAVIAMGLREDDVSLCSVPFSHMNGGGNPQINLAQGATSILARRTEPVVLESLIERERVTVWITAPTVLQRLLRSPGLEHTDRASLRLVLVGGAPVPPSLLSEAAGRLGARCLEVYGLTETAPFVSAGGRAVLGVEVRVEDAEGREVPGDGQSLGELLVRGGAIMSGYHRDPDATREALRGGWLHTGDLASVEPGGLFQIRGRKKDVIVVDGRRVSAREIEAALETHPDVLESCVIAAPDPEHGEIPVGLVVLRGLARPTELNLLEHARSCLAGFKVPRRVQFLAHLPRNEAGEVLKNELRTLYSHA